MSEQDRFLPIVSEIASRFGRVIDLDASPFVMIEILRNFGHALDSNGGGGAGGGTTIAVGITPPKAGEQVELSDVMKVLLKLQRDVDNVGTKLDRLGAARVTRSSK